MPGWTGVGAHRAAAALPPAWPNSAAQALYLLRDIEALNLVARLMAGLHFSGVAHVDMHRASRDGKLYLIEMNSRFW